MKLNKKPSRMLALLCILQLCLLELALVSPQIHAWAFHAEGFGNEVSGEVHSACSTLPQTQDGQRSQRTVPTEDGNEFCPVVLFEQGFSFADGFEIPFFERLAAVRLVPAEPDTVWTSCFKGEVQARAPPVG